MFEIADALEKKYTRIEYERRFLLSANADWQTAAEPYSKSFDDKYLRNTRLRLRVLKDSDTSRRVIKLTKKYESPSPYQHRISRILLSAEEYELINRLDGYRLNKTRHYSYYLERVFSIDVFEGPLEGLVLCETEADGLAELMAVSLPSFTGAEVTDDPFFEGGNLCRTTREDLLRKLASL